MTMQAGSINDEEYALITGLIYDRFGIYLSDKKRALVLQRLQKVLREGGFTTFKDYYEFVSSEETGDALLKMIDAISTNHTCFFREKGHFDILRSSVFPELRKKMEISGDNSIRIWSAGCSSGEEAYCLAMASLDYFGGDPKICDTAVLATDISRSVLKRAEDGVYRDEQVCKQVPAYYRQRYMMQLPDLNWTFTESVRKIVHFRKLNLKQDEYPFRKLFHVIFCRNVMIYFDSGTRKAVISRFARYMAPGGELFLGHSETMDRSMGLFTHLKNARYKKAAGL